MACLAERGICNGRKSALSMMTDKQKLFKLKQKPSNESSLVGLIVFWRSVPWGVEATSRDSFYSYDKLLFVINKSEVCMVFWWISFLY